MENISKNINISSNNNMELKGYEKLFSNKNEGDNLIRIIEVNLKEQKQQANKKKTNTKKKNHQHNQHHHHRQHHHHNHRQQQKQHNQLKNVKQSMINALHLHYQSWVIKKQRKITKKMYKN